MDKPPKDFEIQASSLDPSTQVETVDEVAQQNEDSHYGTQPLVEAPGPSPIAARVQMLKDSALAAGEKHSRLPQTLFWSLFHSEVSEIKRKKARKKLIESLK